MHLLVPALASSPEVKDSKINSINDNSERIKTLSVDVEAGARTVTIKIIDSFAFQADSFGKLLDNLPDDEKHTLKQLACDYQVSFDIFKAKGMFPYDWFDGPDKFDYPALPPREAFHSRLARTVCSKKDYEVGKLLFSPFGSVVKWDPTTSKGKPSERTLINIEPDSFRRWPANRTLSGALSLGLIW